MDSWRAAVDLPANELAPAAARRLMTGLLRAWQQDRRTDDATLVVSELVTNAVQHAGRDVSLQLEVVAEGEVLRLSLADNSTSRPRSREAESGDERGRGMRIVERLTAQWGVEDRSGGKRVWAELR